jgi:hypothetical protein
MAYAIMAEDMLVLCLFFAKGETRTPMGEVIRRAEAYQDKTGHHYGTSNRDFRHVFKIMCPAAGRGRWKWQSYPVDDEPFIFFKGLRLLDFINPMLRQHYAYFNDSEEWWENEEYMRPSDRNLMIRHFFAKPRNNTPEKVMEFLYENGWEESLLDDAMSPSIYKWYDDWKYGDWEPKDRETKEFLGFFDSPFYKEILERKRQKEKKQYRPYR